MRGKRIAILGLGRSGLAIGTAALREGAFPVVFDEKPESELPKRDLLDEAYAAGLRVELGKPFRFPLPLDVDLVVSNPAVPKWHPGLKQAVEFGVEVISEIEFAYRISKAPIVAITGTNGKSTTTVMTYLCLRACGVDAVLCGNIFGSGYPEATLTEAAMNSTPDQVLVAEVSSFQLEWVNSFRPVAAAITNITPDHLDRYESFDEYAETKRRAHAFQTAEDFRVHPSIEASDQFDSQAVPLIVGVDAVVEDDAISLQGQRILKADLPFDGEHNYANAAMAMLLTYAVQARPDVDCIFAGLRDFHGLEHRMVRLGSRGQVEVINNSMCTNPAAVVASAKSLPTRTHLLIGGVNKALDFEPLREYLASGRDVPYLFGTDAEELQKMLGRSEPTYRTMEEAFKAATDQAQPGETIMLAPGCASTDQFRDFRHRGDVFKALAMEWLES